MKDSPDSKNLDVLRSVAVALVVVSHLQFFVKGWPATPAYSFHALGHVGVALFFTHTTLVLMGSLQRNGPAALPFLIRRFFRIYPLALYILVLMTVVQMFGSRPLTAAEFVSNLLLIQNITGHRSMPDPLWTLSYEVQMYLFLPALYAVTLTRRPLLWVGVILVGSVAVALLTELTPLRFVPCFLPGVLAFVLARKPGRHSPWLLAGVVALAALSIPLLVTYGVPEVPLLWVLCLALGLTIPQCRELTSNPIARVSKAIATYSYGVYLTHVAALGLAFSLVQGHWLLQWFVFLVMLSGLSYAAYRVIERPGIRFGARWADALQTKSMRPAVS